jgi:fused signal recognition particle receptor
VRFFRRNKTVGPEDEARRDAEVSEAELDVAAEESVAVPAEETLPAVEPEEVRPEAEPKEVPPAVDLEEARHAVEPKAAVEPTQPEVSEAPPEPPPTPASAPPAPRRGLFARLRQALSRGLFGALGDLLRGRKEIDAELLEELEALLIGSDLGVQTTLDIIGDVEERVSREELTDPIAIRGVIRDHLITTLKQVEAPLQLAAADGPAVVLIIGVNGSGKTTTIGKLAHRLRGEGRKVVIAAADTYRAAAAEQLGIWADRAGAPLVRKDAGADPAAVVFDALRYARDDDSDVVIIDTAGRLHTEVNLMEQLAKIRRVASREFADAPHETLLVLDGTTGQNAISQAELFNRYTDISGLVLTKLDGTSKGGIVVGISAKLRIPVKLIGIGESLEDLRDFEVEPFVDALMGND